MTSGRRGLSRLTEAGGDQVFARQQEHEAVAALRFHAVRQRRGGHHHSVRARQHGFGKGLHRIEPVAVEPDVEFAGIVAVDL